MKELLTQHTALYPRIKELLLGYLFKHWNAMRQSVSNRLKTFSPEEKLSHYWLVEAVIEKLTIA
jgi:hypothetical protein